MTDPVEPRWHGASPESEGVAARYDALEAAAGRGTTRFDRGFRTTLHVVDEGWVSLTSLDDDFHSMRVALRIAADGTITEAEGRMLRHPYDTCPRAMDALARLVGASMARPSAHNQIKHLMPRTEGCLHVADMLVIAFRAFRISKGHDLESYEGEAARRTLLTLMPMMRDTCVSFAVER